MYQNILGGQSQRVLLGPVLWPDKISDDVSKYLGWANPKGSTWIFRHMIERYRTTTFGGLGNNRSVTIRNLAAAERLTKNPGKVYHC